MGKEERGLLKDSKNKYKIHSMQLLLLTKYQQILSPYQWILINFIITQMLEDKLLCFNKWPLCSKGGLKTTPAVEYIFATLIAATFLSTISLHTDFNQATSSTASLKRSTGNLLMNGYIKTSFSSLTLCKCLPQLGCLWLFVLQIFCLLFGVHFYPLHHCHCHCSHSIFSVFSWSQNRLCDSLTKINK